ncbi:flagellar assembly protein FliH [Peribacillus loiseleuriae]|uniref:flagellar assembly protein FliH n=1 Tax=Peribacillus loiseleuriae TaxID=1679170 RepID=UPI0006715627|nr:flagellar assembly protein FliH [Peribacillus loiseleuriae]
MSRIIKSQFAKTVKVENKQIKIRNFDLSDPQGEPLHAQEHIITEQIEAAKREAEALLKEAENKSNQILLEIEQAKKYWENHEKTEHMKQAYDSGFAEGVHTGRSNGYDEWMDKINQASEIVESARQEYVKHIESSEAMILELAIAVAEKIIDQKLEESSEAFLSIVKRTIKEARNYREIQLHIHPVHYEEIIEQKEELEAMFTKETALIIYPDPELSEDSCLIESANGRIDASIDSQLREIKDKLVDLLEGGQ